MNNILFNSEKFKAYWPGKKLHINVIAKFNLARGLSGLTEASSICGTAETRQYNQKLKVESKLRWRGVTVFIDDFICLVKYPDLRSDFNVALLSESKGVKNSHYEQIQKYQNYFQLFQLSVLYQ